MFINYVANQQDLQAIQEGIAKVWHPKLNFIFEDKKLIANVAVVSYDSKFAYVWSKVNFPKLAKIQCGLKQYSAYMIPHKISISDDYQYYWKAGLQPREMAKFLLQKMGADEITTSFISGGLLVPFVTIQKKKRFKNNPYITRESYLATIIHEFGHAYYDQRNLDDCLDKKEGRTDQIRVADETTISFFEGDRAHATAAVFGKIILNSYPEKWPQKLLQ